MNSSITPRLHSRKGFTLIELLVVISIIGLLATLAVVAFGNARKRARDAKRKADIVNIQKALELYYADNGAYPPSASDNPYPSWTNSAYPGSSTYPPGGWSALAAKLKPYIGKLPVDPLNATGKYDDTPLGVFNYEYLSEGNGCPYKFYVLVFRLENPDLPSPGFRTCENNFFNFPGVTIGKRGS